MKETSGLVAGVAPATRPARRRRRSNPAQRREQLVALLATLPAFLLIASLMLYPICYAIWISLNKSDGVKFKFIGLDNYTTLLQDPLVHEVFFVNIKFLAAVPIVIFIAAVCSVLLYERIWGWRFFRVVFFIPNVLSAAVVGLVFRTAFAYDGPVNAALKSLGKDPVDVFSQPNLAIAVIVMALIWSGFGYQTLILLNGLLAIDTDVFAAAQLDGASWWQRFWYITLPNIRSHLAFVSIINVLYTFTSLFGFIFVMTAGGPLYSTTTLDYLVYLLAFTNFDLGKGSALAILIFGLISVLTVLQMRLVRRQEAE